MEMSAVFGGFLITKFFVRGSKIDYTIAGAISATIYASTTTSNLGIIATVCDVCGLGKVEVAKGDTRHIAEKIVKAKGYDICQVDTVAPYTGTYGEIVD